LIGWVPAIFKDRDPIKGIQVELRDNETIWVENNKSVALPERYTKDWDWRYQIQQDVNVDACDDFGHWYLSTVLAIRTKARSAPSYEPIIDKVQIAYRHYTPQGNKRDNQGRLYEGWSSMYDEWISVNSLRIQKPLSICSQGAVYCKSQLDRDAYETSHASDILQFNDQFEVKYALERTDYESPYIIVKVLDYFCKMNGFEELYMRLHNMREITSDELVGVIKGLACVAPLIHKRYLVSQISSYYNELMKKINEVLTTELSKETIKKFVDVSFMLSGLTSQLYTQRTKQEKMEQFLILLAKACLSRYDNDLIILGEELVEKLCYYKEYPYCYVYDTYDWLIDYVNDKPLFWKKLAENFKNGFDYSCLAVIHLITSANNNNLNKWLKTFDKKAIVDLLLRLRDVLPKNITSLQTNMLIKLKTFYSNEEEIVETVNKLLWEFTNPETGFTKSIVEESKKLLPKGSIQSKKILGWALEDIKEVKDGHKNLIRSIEFIHKFKDGYIYEPKDPTSKDIFSKDTMQLILSNFEKYYWSFKKANIFPDDMLVTLEHRRLTPKGIRMHQREVSAFLRYVIDYVGYNKSIDVKDIIKHVWNILVINSAIEEDAIEFYSEFADMLIKENKGTDTNLSYPFRELFSEVIAPYDNPPKGLPRDILYKYLNAILHGAMKVAVILDYGILGSSDFWIIPLKPVAEFPGIEFFLQLLEKVKSNEVFFEILLILSKLYYYTKEIDKLSELAIKVLDVLHPMVMKGFTSGKYKLFSLCIDTLDYIINATELLGGYIPSLYELNSRAKPEIIHVNINNHIEEFNMYPDASIRVLVRNICKKVKTEYGNIVLINTSHSDIIDPHLYLAIEELQKGRRPMKFTANVLNEVIYRGNILPSIEKVFENLFDRLATEGIFTVSSFIDFFYYLFPTCKEKTLYLFATLNEKYEGYLNKSAFVKFCNQVIKLYPKMLIEKLVKYGIILDQSSLFEVTFNVIIDLSSCSF